MGAVEKWRAIQGFEGRYEVSDLGNVRSLDWRGEIGPSKLVRSYRGRPLTLSVGTGGYLMVRLNDRRMHSVHRLVLAAFVGPCPLGCEGAHFDGVKSNNRLDNLRWATPVENAADRDRHGSTLRGNDHPAAILSSPQVAEIRAARGIVSQRQVARKYGISQGHVSDIQAGRFWS